MRHAPGQDGNALLAALGVAVVLAGLASTVTTVVHSAHKSHSEARDQLLLGQITDAGARFALQDLNSGGTGVLGSLALPLPFGAGTYFTQVLANGDGTFSVTSTGMLNQKVRSVRAHVQSTSSVFDNAIFAGNESGDPNYTLDFGGTGSQADEVNGDIFSGGNLEVRGDASISGAVRAAGVISGATGEKGKQDIPDIAGMHFETNHDVNVKNEFNSYATYQSDDAGGSAWQLPEQYASHIFRKNPSDRLLENASTTKDDYFLEDPYEPVRSDNNQNGSDAYHITLAGRNGDPGPDSNNKVYYIDGNLWIHNKKSYSFKIYDNDFVKVTFVVKGNIYISDNLFMKNKNKDGLALIAIKDAAVANSGNVYFGDPAFGTLRAMQAFMYAENNFYDNNLDASGSAKVVVDGIMSAGNHVAINRDFGSQHSRLEVNFDDRVSSGALVLPGLPASGGTKKSYAIVAWQRTTSQ